MPDQAGPEKFEWYYVGHYGQLGPLSLEQLKDLIEDGVVERDTYVWRAGMTDWLPAKMTPALAGHFEVAQSHSPPPPPGTYQGPPVVQPQFQGYQQPPYGASMMNTSYATPIYAIQPSDRNRVAAGVLQLLIPGIGRMYLGYMAQGILQFLSSMCFLLGWVWSVVDGILILCGTVKVDGYGRRLSE